MPRARRIPTFLMGADPELALFKNGRLYSANNIEGLDTYGQFGRDGCGTIAELRPAPAEEPEQLVENLRICLAEGRQKYPAIRRCALLGGSCYAGHPIGGHIHFGIKKKFGAHIPGCLDSLLAQVVIPLESVSQALARRENYGRFGDWRTQRWGFEYRSLSSWMTTPQIALGVLSLAKVVATEALMDTDSLFSNKCYALMGGISCVSKCTIARMRRHLPSIKEAVGRCCIYPKYAKSIGFLYSLLEDRRTWFTSTSLVEEWGVAHVRGGAPPPQPESTMLRPQTLEALLLGRVNIL